MLRKRINYRVSIFEIFVTIIFTALSNIRKSMNFRNDICVIKIFINRSKIYFEIRKQQYTVINLKSLLFLLFLMFVNQSLYAKS